MAYKTLSAAQHAVGKAFMHDVFVCAGVTKNKRTKEGPFALEDLSPTGYGKSIIKACKTITDCILEGDFANIDSEFDTLSRWHFNPNFYETRTFSKDCWVRKPASMLMQYVADFCAIQGFYWNDALLSKYELDEFCNSAFGKALRDFGCFTSQPDAPSKAVAAAMGGSGSASVSSTGSTAGSATPGQPANNYKSTGPQSGNVRDLISTPGQKEKFTTAIFSVEGENSKAQKVKAFAFIKPLSPQGDANGTNKIFVGSSNGYTDCKIYVSDIFTADDLKTYCEKIAGPNITNLKVVKKSPDSNGYYEVNTEFGHVFIPAKKLNEAAGIVECGSTSNVTEELTEEQKDAAWTEFSDRRSEFDKNLRSYYN